MITLLVKEKLNLKKMNLLKQKMIKVFLTYTV